MTIEVTVALIGVGGALLGSLIGGCASYLALRTQLMHQAEQTERSRQLTLRREVYLEAVASLARAQVQLSTLGRPEIDLATIIDQMKDYPEVLAKAQIVASESTFRAFDTFGEFMISRVADLLPRRFKVVENQREIAAENRNAALLNQRRESLQQILQGVVPSDPLHSEIISDLYKIDRSLMSANERLNDLSTQNLSCVEELVRLSAEASFSAQVEAGKVLAKIRSEMEIPIGEDWYSSHLENRRLRLTESFNHAFASVKEAIDDSDSGDARK